MDSFSITHPAGIYLFNKKWTILTVYQDSDVFNVETIETTYLVEPKLEYTKTNDTDDVFAFRHEVLKFYSLRAV